MEDLWLAAFRVAEPVKFDKYRLPQALDSDDLTLLVLTALGNSGPIAPGDRILNSCFSGGCRDGTAIGLSMILGFIKSLHPELCWHVHENMFGGGLDQSLSSKLGVRPLMAIPGPLGGMHIAWQLLKRGTPPFLEYPFCGHASTWCAYLEHRVDISLLAKKLARAMSETKWLDLEHPISVGPYATCFAYGDDDQEVLGLVLSQMDSESLLAWLKKQAGAKRALFDASLETLVEMSRRERWPSTGLTRVEW